MRIRLLKSDNYVMRVRVRMHLLATVISNNRIQTTHFLIKYCPTYGFAKLKINMIYEISFMQIYTCFRQMSS